MKITDYAIVFMAIITSFVVIYILKDNMLFQSIVYNEEINRILDNATVDALNKGYIGIGDTEEKIDNEKIVESFFENMCYMLYGVDSNKNRKKISDNILCFIIINEDSYCLFEKGEVSEKYFFTDMLHEKRVNEIEKLIEDRIKGYNYKVLFPKNNGEHNSQTINPNSLMVVYRTSINSFFGESYAECIISGATIKLIES